MTPPLRLPPPRSGPTAILLAVLASGGGCGEGRPGAAIGHRPPATPPAPALAPPIRSGAPARGVPVAPTGSTPEACGAPPSRQATRDTRLDARWRRFHRWVASRGWQAGPFANHRRFTPAVGDALRRRLRALTDGNRAEAYRLAIRLLGLAARTRGEGGSRWDCTTRMFQLVAQARRLAGIQEISYTGFRSATRRVETVAGPAVFFGEHLSHAVLTLMAVAHYRDPRLGPRNLRWKGPLLPAGGLLAPPRYRHVEVGDVLFYPEFGPGHFGVVLRRTPTLLVVAEGYWRGQPTVIHLYPRRPGLDPACLYAQVADLPGFAALGTRHGGEVTWARNVLVTPLAEKGPLRLAVHR